MKILTTECSGAVYISSNVFRYMGPRVLPITSHGLAPCLPAPVQRAKLQGNPSERDARDRESEEEPRAAESGKLSLFSHILSNIAYFILQNTLWKSFETSIADGPFPNPI